MSHFTVCRRWLHSRQDMIALGTCPFSQDFSFMVACKRDKRSNSTAYFFFTSAAKSIRSTHSGASGEGEAVLKASCWGRCRATFTGRCPHVRTTCTLASQPFGRHTHKVCLTFCFAPLWCHDSIWLGGFKVVRPHKRFLRLLTCSHLHKLRFWLSSCHGLHNNLLHWLSRSYGLHKLRFWLPSCHGLHNNLLHWLSRSYGLHKLRFWLSSCHGLHNNLLHCLSRSYGLHKLRFWLSSCHGLHNNLLHCLSRSYGLHKLRFWLSSCHGLHNNLLHCLSRSYGLHKLHFWLSSCHGLHNNLLHCLSRSFCLHKLLLAPSVLHNLLLGHHSIRPIAKACRRTCSRWRIFYLSCKARGAAGEPQEIASGSSSRTTTTSTSNFRQKANETNGTKKRERKNKRQRDQGRGQWRTHPCPRTPP